MELLQHISRRNHVIHSNIGQLEVKFMLYVVLDNNAGQANPVTVISEMGFEFFGISDLFERNVSVKLHHFHSFF